jgi:hypothetical protein
MVAEIFQMPDSRGDTDRYRALRYRGSPAWTRKTRSGGASADPALIERLIAGDLIEPRPLPVTKSNPDRGPPIRHWKDNQSAANAVLRQHIAPEPREEESWMRRHRLLERIYGRSLSPFPPGS